MSNTKQHFVPKFYLRKWSDSKEKIWKYKTDGAAPIHISVDNVAFERGLYSHPATDKVPPLKTEKFLGEKIEGLYADKWPEIIDRAEDIETRKNIARFVALMILRHPQEKENIRTVNKAFREAVTGHSPDEEVEFVIKGKSIIIRVGEVLKSASDDQDTIQSQFLRDIYNRIIARGATRFVYAHNENPDLAAKISEWRSTLRRD